MNLQPLNLENELIKLIPLTENDFDKLYKVASDPLIWEQHPEKNRYKEEVFRKYFAGAMESKGAFLIYDNKSGELVGSSRYYDFDEISKTVAIGYTFLSRDHWGTIYNRALKSLMLNYAFQYTDEVYFHIGPGNIRSQKAISKLGAVFTDEKKLNAGYGGDTNNLVYKIEKKNWMRN